MIREESANQHPSARTRFVTQFAHKMGMDVTEAGQFLHRMAEAEAEQDDVRREGMQENLDLMLAVQFNARMRNVQHQEQFRKFRFRLNNGSSQAIRLARLWVDRKISFDQMLAS